MGIYAGAFYSLDYVRAAHTVYVIDDATGEIVLEVQGADEDIALAQAREEVEDKGGLINDHSNVDRR